MLGVLLEAQQLESNHQSLIHFFVLFLFSFFKIKVSSKTNIRALKPAVRVVLVQRFTSRRILGSVELH